VVQQDGDVVTFPDQLAHAAILHLFAASCGECTPS
jgi:hypothetical protein